MTIRYTLSICQGKRFHKSVNALFISKVTFTSCHERCLSSTSREGFGSFHSEDVEVLIRQNDDIYSHPAVHNEILSKLKHENDAIIENFDFGSQARKSLFTLDDDWTFINHGAFGATLSPLLHESNSWRFKCESQPLRFHDRYLLPMIALTVRETANFLNCPPHELVPLPNVTSGLNSVIRSIPLEVGDEIICLSITYGSTKKIMKDVCTRSGATLKVVEIPLPVRSPESVISLLKKALTNRTKLVVLDQITSNTAIMLPIADMALYSKDAGATVIIDAAHALFSQDCSIYTPDQEVFGNDITLPSNYDRKSSNRNELDSIKNDINNYSKITDSLKNHENYDVNKKIKKKICIADFADIWITNAHKWMSGPKGCAFMWVSPRMALKLRPAIISHGYVSNEKDFLRRTIVRNEKEGNYDDKNTTQLKTDLESECESNNLNDSKYLGHYIASNKLLSSFSWDGCRDYSALLTMPSAIAFWGKLSNSIKKKNEIQRDNYPTEFDNIENHNFTKNYRHDIDCGTNDIKKKKQRYDLTIFRNYNRNLLKDANQLMSKEWGVGDDDFAAPQGMREYSPMSLIPLPPRLCGVETDRNNTDKDAFALQELLHFEHKIEVPVKCLEGKLYTRISAHIYNTPEEYERLAYVIKKMI